MSGVFLFDAMSEDKFRGTRAPMSDPALELAAVGTLSIGTRGVDDTVGGLIDRAVDDLPPRIHYSTAFCSPNTFQSSGTGVQPLQLRKVLVETLELIPVDVTSTTSWNLECVFYPNETKTSFLLKLFDYSVESIKGACLVEMQMIEGDRFAFENLCAHVQRVTALDDAFKSFDEGFGFESADDDATIEVASKSAPYQHAEWKPLPLPVLSRSTSNVEAVPMADTDMSLFSPAPACAQMPSMIDVLAMNTFSPFVDARRNGWHELAKATGEPAIAKSFLGMKSHGQSGIEMIAAALRGETEGNEDGLLEDLHRCALKTLSNVAACASRSQLQEIGRLKSIIISMAQRGNSIETRAVAVSLIDRLATPEDDDYITTLETCSAEKCRFSLHAKSALENLGPLVLC